MRVTTPITLVALSTKAFAAAKLHGILSRWKENVVKQLLSIEVAYGATRTFSRLCNLENATIFLVKQLKEPFKSGLNFNVT